MKKIISLALVFVMVFAIGAIAVSAEVSPTSTGLWSITVSSEGDGTASADKTSVPQGAGESVVLTATENGGYFTKWIMTGSYDVVSGDVNSAVFEIIPKSDITAIASFRKEKDYFTIIIADSIGDGTVTANPEKVKIAADGSASESCTITAIDGKDKFAKWIIACDYDIVSGDMYSRELVIKPYTDIHVTGVFTSDGEPPVEPNKKPSETSPKTGDPTLAIIAIIMMASAAGVFAVKKIKE